MTEVPGRTTSALSDRDRLERELGQGGMATTSRRGLGVDFLMNRSSVLDTTVGVQQRQLARIRALRPADRLGRALALSALGREFAWAGARRVAGSRGQDAVRYRFLEQTLGADMAGWVERRIAAESGS